MAREEREHCPLCHGATFRRFPIHYYLHEKRFDAKKCVACKFIFVSPRPTRDEIAQMYSNEYFLHDGAECGAHSMTDYETAAVKGSVKFPEILRYIAQFKPAGDFFEVGCGMGYFLNYVRSRGYTVNGIEYAPLGAKVAKEKFGLDITCSLFENYHEAPHSYDVIFFGDVLEHLMQPLEMLQKAYRLLRADGVVAVEVPSMFNCLAGRGAETTYTMLGYSKRMPMPPYHVNEFTPRTLRDILQKAGYRRAIIFQRIKHPSTIALRGSLLEKAVKLGLQYPNYLVTNVFGVLGDRMVGIGIK